MALTRSLDQDRRVHDGGTERARSRPDPITALFPELSSKEYLPMLHHQSGTIRIDLHDGSDLEHWHVALDNGCHRADGTETVRGHDERNRERQRGPSPRCSRCRRWPWPAGRVLPGSFLALHSRSPRFSSGRRSGRAEVAGGGTTRGKMKEEAWALAGHLRTRGSSPSGPQTRPR